MTLQPANIGAARMIDPSDPPVVVIRELRVRRGQESQFEEVMAALTHEAARQPGHMGTTVVRPLTPGDLYRFIYKFDRRSNLEAWHGSPIRAQLYEPVRALIEFDRSDQYAGLEAWFEFPRAGAPPKWKTTLMSWGMIYVLVMAVSYTFRALNFQAPLPVRALVLTAIIVPLVSYVIGPWLGRLLHPWLHKGLTPGSPKRVKF